MRYDFKCPQCEKIIESSSRDNQQTCSDNHEPVDMIRVYSIGGIVFKGNGFYKTDTKNKIGEK